MPYEAELNINGVIPSKGGSSREIVNHKLSEGDNLFRIMPPFGTNHGGLPFAEINLHWFTDSAGNKRPLACSFQTERYCPVCEEAQKIYKEKEALVEEYKDNKTQRVNFKILPENISNKYQELNDKHNGLRAQRGYYYNAMDSSGRIGILRLPKTAATKLGELIREAVTVHGFNPLSLEGGATFNIVQTRDGPKIWNVKYDVKFVTKSTKTEHGVQLFIEQSKVPQSVMENFEKLAYDLHVMYPRRTAAELKRALLGDETFWRELDEQKRVSRETQTKAASDLPEAKIFSKPSVVPPTVVNAISEPEREVAPPPQPKQKAAPAVLDETDAELQKLRKQLGMD